MATLLEPGAAVGFVIQLGDEDFIAGLEGAGDGVGQDEIEACHIGSEGDGFRAFRAQQGSDLCAGVVDELISFPGGDKLAMCIGVAMAVYIHHRVDDRLGDLGASRAIEVEDRAAVDDSFQGRELAANGIIH